MTEAQRATLRQHLIRDEGVVLHAYQDTGGWWTIGVGHLIDARNGGGIPRDIAERLLDHDIDRAVAECRRVFRWFEGLDAVRQNVVINMAFNLGVAGLQKFTRTLDAVARGDYEAAAKGMLASRWAAQTKGRAVRLAQTMRTGVDVA